jgi:hypothetical protein
VPADLRQTTIVDVLDLALDLERRTMALYAGFLSAFGDDEELRRFWFGMARGEAGHCGALMLVECLLRDTPELGGNSAIRFDMSTGVRLRSLLTAYRREQRRGVTLERSLEMAVDLEGSELEDVVVELLQVVPDPGWRERFTDNAELLARADALAEARAGRGQGGKEAETTRDTPRKQRSSPRGRKARSKSTAKTKSSSARAAGKPKSRSARASPRTPRS